MESFVDKTVHVKYGLYEVDCVDWIIVDETACEVEQVQTDNSAVL